MYHFTTWKAHQNDTLTSMPAFRCDAQKYLNLPDLYRSTEWAVLAFDLILPHRSTLASTPEQEDSIAVHPLIKIVK